MCKVTTINLNGRDVKVAEIKKDCIRNISEAAKSCKYIDQIILFGSALGEHCTDQSDVDIAVFGSVSKNRCLTSKEYKDFTHQLYRFDDYSQAYDILYFKTGTNSDSGIRREIEKGAVIYG